MNVLYYFSFCPLCGLTKYTVVGTALSPALTVGMPAIGLGDSHVLFSPGHQCRSTEVRFQDCSSHSPRPAVGTMEAAQTLADGLPRPGARRGEWVGGDGRGTQASYCGSPP